MTRLSFAGIRQSTSERKLGASTGAAGGSGERAPAWWMSLATCTNRETWHKAVADAQAGMTSKETLTLSVGMSTSGGRPQSIRVKAYF